MMLEMKNIYKAFDANQVLKGVSISLRKGEVYALLGENGAGKSTLMNILGGVLKADSGEIYLDEEKVKFKNPSESLDKGIAFIHQELNLINDLAIYENMFIGRELKKKSGLLDRLKMIEQTQKVFDNIGVNLDPKTMVSELDASYKQIVEIARALMMKASIIIMDEPTTSLTETEIERVFKMMNTLKEHGVSMIFISHKLREVMEICDRYAVLRDGNLVKEGLVKDTNINELAHHLVGHDVRTEALQRNKQSKDEILRVENLSYENIFNDIFFNLKSGEILGVTGLLGDGRSELFQAIFGDIPNYTGNIYFKNSLIKMRNIKQALKLGIGYVPRNRKENGIIKDLSILENGSLVTLGRDSKFGLINYKAKLQEFDLQKNNLKIKMEKVSDLITSLSGGNQQKVVLAKWLNHNPKVLIMDNPTQGVDVGAKEEIYDIILALADKGVAVVVLSSEASEIIRVCDRTLVMYHGNIQGELQGRDMNERAIMTLATGGKLEDKVTTNIES
ncbi:sugar ABC transporter ATP-binding protein [Clostridium sp. NSJ-145]|uniref:sugar ABC transporter ATP-binding protein n=1 Tax=Clostridium sp. NSJ-145 TaxID=2897777 RepID=UPI001E3C4BD4|nr:sugar ABC transporter ATP-binding protein [Clostridium sp. NSJ-145]MCD2502811.1 sugar ABC transporter ATP-binding protein [Clostridium sp. NSJ-145]